MKTFAANLRIKVGLPFFMQFKSALAIGIVVLFAATLAALSQPPELVIQEAHTGDVDAVAFSSDGHLLASASSDNTLKLWDVASGRVLRTFSGKSLLFYESVSFSSDNSKIITWCVERGNNNKIIIVWDVVSGQEIYSVSGDYRQITSDGEHFAAIGDDQQSVLILDPKNGKELRKLVSVDPVFELAFSPDGNTLAVGGPSITLWDAGSGREIRKFPRLDEDAITSLSFSSDGRKLIVGNSTGIIRIWDVAGGRQLYTFTHGKDSIRPIANDKIASIVAGKQQVLENGILKTQFFVASAADGKELQTFNGENFLSSALSPDGKVLATGNRDSSIKLWEARTGRELTSFPGRSTMIYSVAFGSDGKQIVSGSYDHNVRVWLSSGEMKTLAGHTGMVTSVAINPINGQIASGSWDKTIKVWDQYGELRTLKGHTAEIQSVTFSSDGKWIASSARDKTVRLWDAATGKQLQVFTATAERITSVSISPDKSRIITGNLDLWNTATGRLIKTFAKVEGFISPVTFSPDGKLIASGENSGMIKIWDASTGSLVRSITAHTDWVWSVAFSPDGKRLASSSHNREIKVWDVATGKELKGWSAHASVVFSVGFSPDGGTIVTGGEDGTVALWDSNTGDELCRLVAVGETDWLVTTPDGLFDGSPTAWNKISWRFNKNTFDYSPVEAFFTDFYHPGLLTDILSGKHPKAPVDISTKDRRQPAVTIATADSRSESAVSARSVKVRIGIVQAGGGAQDLRLFRNGSLVKVWHGDVMKGQTTVMLDATVPIVAGDNNLTAYAFNRDNVKSSDAALIVSGAESLKRKGVAYVLAVGVNQYANTEYNLTYAAADAKDFSDELKRQQEKLGTFDHVQVVSLNDKDATKANILKAIDDIAVKILPEDSLTIYFAGHGTAKENRFYLIPHDLGYTGGREKLDDAGLKTILSHSISDEELEAAVEGIDAGQMLLVIDACNSGQALEAEEKRRGPMNSKGLAQLAYEKGMYILTAAQSYQAAKEAAKLGHGFLTYALVEEGLKTSAADREPKDGQILLREWLDYATGRVPQMQQDDIKTRQLEREGQANAKNDSLQHPRVFYRREAETHPLVIARP